MIQIYFQCVDCAKRNKNLLGTHGFERLQTDFDTFSDAWQHMTANPNHTMLTKIYDDSDEQDD